MNYKALLVILMSIVLVSSVRKVANSNKFLDKQIIEDAKNLNILKNSFSLPSSNPKYGTTY